MEADPLDDPRVQARLKLMRAQLIDDRGDVLMPDPRIGHVARQLDLLAQRLSEALMLASDSIALDPYAVGGVAADLRRLARELRT